MSRKEYFLIAVVVVLVGVYVVYFTDWFQPRVMRIEHSSRSQREAWRGSQKPDPTGKQQLGGITFSLHHKYKLNSIKIVPLSEYLTNKYTPAVWALDSAAGSDPVDGFVYGLSIPGMTQTRPILEPEPLEPGVAYRLIVQAGKLQGEHDFTLGAATGRYQ